MSRKAGAIQFIPNPPEYTLRGVDLEFLAKCVLSHVAYPEGLSYHSISNQLTSPDYQISLAAVKLTRLGFIEKSVELGERDDQYFAYRATEDGLDIFLKHEDKYAVLQAEMQAAKQNVKNFGQSRTLPKSGSNVASGFEDMDKDIPF